jgi:hypothetical protein
MRLVLFQERYLSLYCYQTEREKTQTVEKTENYSHTHKANQNDFKWLVKCKKTTALISL